MKINFNPAQLERSQRNNLFEVLGAIESRNDEEIEVTVVEFPKKFMVKLSEDKELLFGWDSEKRIFAALETPERLEQDISDLASEVVEKPDSPNEPQAGAIKNFELPVKPAEPVSLEPELVKSEIGQRVAVLAASLVKLSEPLDSYQRCEVWSQFCQIYIRELML